jgi:hypothetical protein
MRKPLLVKKITTVHTVLTLAVAKEWYLFEIVIKNVFLQGELEE